MSVKSIEKVIEAFRKKWGRFYYSDEVGMDWEKPVTQNITGGIPIGHSGFCLASGDMERDLRVALLTTLKQQREKVLEDYTNWLVKHRYCDSDVYAEEPKAVDRYLIEQQDEKED